MSHQKLKFSRLLDLKKQIEIKQKTVQEFKSKRKAFESKDRVRMISYKLTEITYKLGRDVVIAHNVSITKKAFNATPNNSKFYLVAGLFLAILFTEQYWQLIPWVFFLTFTLVYSKILEHRDYNLVVMLEQIVKIWNVVFLVVSIYTLIGMQYYSFHCISLYASLAFVLIGNLLCYFEIHGQFGYQTSATDVENERDKYIVINRIENAFSALPLDLDCFFSFDFEDSRFEEDQSSENH